MIKFKVVLVHVAVPVQDEAIIVHVGSLSKTIFVVCARGVDEDVNRKLLKVISGIDSQSHSILEWHDVALPQM